MSEQDFNFLISIQKKAINYAALLNDGEDDDDDDDVKIVKDGTANFSSDEELLDNTVNMSVESENMFDSLKEDKSMEKSAEKPKQKRKLGPKMETNTSKRPKKKNSYSGSDDDFEASKVSLSFYSVLRL